MCHIILKRFWIKYRCNLLLQPPRHYCVYSSPSTGSRGLKLYLILSIATTLKRSREQKVEHFSLLWWYTVFGFLSSECCRLIGFAWTNVSEKRVLPDGESATLISFICLCELMFFFPCDCRIGNKHTAHSVSLLSGNAFYFLSVWYPI